jgi:hypothetical protein
VLLAGPHVDVSMLIDSHRPDAGSIPALVHNWHGCRTPPLASGRAAAGCTITSVDAAALAPEPPSPNLSRLLARKSTLKLIRPRPFHPVSFVCVWNPSPAVAHLPSKPVDLSLLTLHRMSLLLNRLAFHSFHAKDHSHTPLVHVKTAIDC